MLAHHILPLVALGSLVGAIPAALRQHVSRSSNSNSCTGYTASNVKTDDSSLTADLHFGDQSSCNLFGEDLKDLKLLVEYQTGQYILLPLAQGRIFPSCMSHYWDLVVTFN